MLTGFCIAILAWAFFMLALIVSDRLDAPDYGKIALLFAIMSSIGLSLGWLLS